MKRYMHLNVHKGIIYNCQDTETTQVLTDRWMDKETAVHNGILLNHKKNKMLPFAATWMDLGGIMLSKVSQRKINTVWYHLYV